MIRDCWCMSLCNVEIWRTIFSEVCDQPVFHFLLGFWSPLWEVPFEERSHVSTLMLVCNMAIKTLTLPLYNLCYPSSLATGSLDLPWSTRMKIALGAAKGLAFLHEEAERRVIYRDFKTSNILLDAVCANIMCSHASRLLSLSCFLSCAAAGFQCQALGFWPR